MELDVTGLKPLEAPADNLDVTGLKEMPSSIPEQPEHESWGTTLGKAAESVVPALRSGAGGSIYAVGEMENRYNTMVRKLQEDYRRMNLNSADAAALGMDPKYHKMMGENDLAPRGTPSIARYGRDMYLDAQDELRQLAPDVEDHSAQWYAYHFTRVMGEMAPALAVAAITRMPTLGASVIGAQVGGTQYGESREERGRSPQQAMTDASVMAATEILTERIPLGILIKQGTGLASRLKNAALSEGAQEAITESLQMGYQMGVFGDEITLGDAMQRIVDAAILGSAAGGSMAVIVEPIHRLQAARSEPQPGKRQEASARAQPLTPEDEASPLPNDLIQKGRAGVEDAKAVQEANEMLEKAGAPVVGGSVMVDTESGPVAATVRDAYGTLNNGGIFVAMPDGSVQNRQWGEFTNAPMPANDADIPEGAVDAQTILGAVDESVMEAPQKQAAAGGAASAPRPVRQATAPLHLDPATGSQQPSRAKMRSQADVRRTRQIAQGEKSQDPNAQEIAGAAQEMMDIRKRLSEIAANDGIDLMSLHDAPPEGEVNQFWSNAAVHLEASSEIIDAVLNKSAVGQGVTPEDIAEATRATDRMRQRYRQVIKDFDDGRKIDTSNPKVRNELDIDKFSHEAGIARGWIKTAAKPDVAPTQAQPTTAVPEVAPEPEPVASAGDDSKAADGEPAAQAATTAVPEKMDRTPAKDADAPGPVVEDYADKSVIVRGVSREQGEDLFKDMKAKPLWNEGQQGWVFSKKHRGTVTGMINEMRAEKATGDSAIMSTKTIAPQDADGAATGPVVKINTIDMNAEKARQDAEDAARAETKKTAPKPVGENIYGEPLVEDSSGRRTIQHADGSESTEGKWSKGQKHGEDFRTAEEDEPSAKDGSSRPTVPIEDDRALQRDRKLKQAGDDAARAGDPDLPPDYLDDEGQRLWLSGWWDRHAKMEAQKQAEKDADGADAKKPSDYGKSNKLFTEDAAEKARAKLRDKLRQVNSGLDPEIVQAGVTLAGYHIEAGARSFAAFTKAMVADLGDAARPYLRSWYEGVRYYPGFDAKGMTPAQEIPDTLDQGDDAPSDANAPAKETGDELQGTVRTGDAGAGTEDASGTDAKRPVRSAPAGEVSGGARDAETDDGGSAQGQGRKPAPGREDGSRESGDAGPDRVPAGDRPKGLKPKNHVIREGDLDEGRGFKTKARDNIAAIETLNAIEAEGRAATPDEQKALARYVGWGGIKGAFPNAEGDFAKGYEDIGERLTTLLTPDEYQTARRSIQYAHYTSETVVRAMWKHAVRMGFSGGRVFEPGMGIGNFAGMMPEAVSGKTDYIGIEMDHVTARIAEKLYPKWGASQGDFTKHRTPKDTFDLVIGNPPFGDIPIKADRAYAKHAFLIHDYFFAKSLDAVRPGGLLMFVSSAGTMNKLDTKAREYMADRADLVGAVRLPGDAFEKNAGTSVTTDIIVLRKRMEGEQPGDTSWVGTEPRTLPDKFGKQTTGNVNAYFGAHPEMVLGQEGFFDRLYPGRYAVRSEEGADIAAMLDQVLGNLPSGIVSAKTGQKSGKDEKPRALDFASGEKKNGSFYLADDGTLMQLSSGAGVPVEVRGKGVKGGKSKGEIEKIKALIPVRDALRSAYSAYTKATDEAAIASAQKALNKAYDAFVASHGPINKAVITRRAPTIIQQEAARQAAREEARYNDTLWDPGSFDEDAMIAEKASTSAIARARADHKELVGDSYSDGSFDPSDVPETITAKYPNLDPFRDDPESYRLSSIEDYNDDTGKATKGRPFYENVVSTETTPKIESVEDAVLFIMNKTGRLDIRAIAEAAGMSEERAIEDLGDRIYRVPVTREWETASSYLSGDVKQKLKDAEHEAKKNPEFSRNVEALRRVQPEDLPPSQIHAVLGMPWIPPEFVSDFMTDALKLESADVSYQKSTGEWRVSGDTTSSASTAKWGIGERLSAVKMVEFGLSRQPFKVSVEYWEDGKKKTRIDPTATQAAQDKVQEIKDLFSDWVWKDEVRSERLVRIYNDTFNTLVSREFDGDYLTTPGMATGWKLRPHQRRVVSRIIETGNTYMAHTVGAGKTSAMIAAGMERRRMGLSKKPMYSVPNNMLAQFTREFYHQYPTAKIAVADERQFHADRRKQFFANVSTADLDAVIITHTAFGRIGVSTEFQDGVIEGMISQYREVLEELKNDPDAGRHSRSRVENQIETLEQRLGGKDLVKDDVITFEQMGVDFLFVDEAHKFRKLDFATRMSGVKGVSPVGSKMSWDLYMKALYLDSMNPGNSLVLASGTPITNTMAELFTLSRYLQEKDLADRGIGTFDTWAASFGDTTSKLEQDASGGYKQVARFAKFVNVPELSMMVRQVMDVVTGKQLEEYVTRPSIKGGSRKMNLAQRSAYLVGYQEQLASRMKAIEDRKGPPKPGDDIMLSVINDGRHAAIDMRLVNPESRNDPGSKLNLLVDNVFDIWERTKRAPLHAPTKDGYKADPVDIGPATQMVFANLGISGKRGFSVVNYIRSEMKRRGVPEDQVAFISEAKSHIAKQRLINDFNEGKVRILIGSTDKMGVGINGQRRLKAVHNLDPLWFPADDKQRNGRILRQGNMNPEIEIHDYSTKGTYDSTMWDMMATKARFIQAFLEGDMSMRDMDDLGEASQYEQAKALSTADPRIMILTEKKHELEREERRKSSIEMEANRTARKIRDARSARDHATETIQKVMKDIERRKDISGDQFAIQIDGETITDRVKAGEAILSKYDGLFQEGRTQEIRIGDISGFPVILNARAFNDSTLIEGYIIREGEREEQFRIGESAKGVVQSIEGILRAFDADLKRWEGSLSRAEKDIADFTGHEAKQFTGQDRIDSLRGEISSIEKELQAESAKKARENSPGPGMSEDGRKFEMNDAVMQSLVSDGMKRDLQKQLRDFGIADKVGITFMKRIEGFVDGQKFSASGSYYKRLIEVSLASSDPAGTLNHEVIHALRDIGLLRDSEWRALSRAAHKDGALMKSVRRRYSGQTLTEDQITEEAVADLFARRASLPEKTMGFIATGMKRIADFIEALGNALRGNGAITADSVFADIESGSVGRREEPVTGQRSGPAYSIPDAPDARGLDATSAKGAQGRRDFLNRILGSQPLDKAIRMPFEVFGDVNEQGVWSRGQNMHERAQQIITKSKFSDDGRFAFLNPALETARSGLIDRHGLDPAYVERERRRSLDERSIMSEIPEIMERLKSNGVDGDEAVVLQAVLTGEAVPAEKMAALSEPIRNAIDGMGAEAVSLGLLSSEAFERNRGEYLHRVYMKHESDQGGLSRWAARLAGSQRKKIIGNQFKGRGLWIDVSMDRLFQDFGAITDGISKGERFRVLDRLAKETDPKGNVREKRRVMKRVFLPENMEVPSELAGYRDSGVWEMRGTKANGNIILWRDFTKPEREQMGEIVDARYTISKTYMTMAHDLATGRFYRDIAQNADWSQEQEPEKGTWKDAGEYRMRHWGDPDVHWVRVPETVISKSATPRYGKLSGRYIRAEIWRDIQEIDRAQKSTWWDAMMRQWKMNKTARSPVVHMNNVMSNVMLMDLADVRLSDLVDGIRSMATKDEHYRDAMEHGAFGSDMVSMELQRSVLKPLLDEIERDMRGGKDTMEARIGTVGKIADRIWSVAKGVDRKMMDMYRLEDEVFRMATYMRNIQRGMQPDAAAIDARDQFLNYDIHAPWINTARRYFLPFISYSYRAIPLIAKNVAHRPWKLAKYATVAYAMNAMGYVLTGDDEDEERRSMRENEQGMTWVGVPRMIKLPFSDSYGNPMFLDVRRWVPAGDVFDFNQGQSAIPLPSWLQMGGPLIMGTELFLNRQAFTGRDIVNHRTDDTWDAASKIADWGWKSWMPSAAWIPGSWYWGKIGDAITGTTDYEGRPYDIPSALASSVGVKVKSQDVETGFYLRGREFNRIERDLKSEMYRIRMDRDRNMISEATANSRIQKVISKLNRLDRARAKTFGR